MRKYIFVKFKLAVVVFLLLAVSLTASCAEFGLKITAVDLMEDISSRQISSRAVDDKFIKNAANFSLDIFKKTFEGNYENNALISPLSVLLALSMTTNGAANETLAQMISVIGGDIKLDELNEYLYTYAGSLPNETKSKLNIANSIWFRDNENRLVVEKDFLQNNADYYNADSYKSPFNDQTLADINNWVKIKTDGMIDKILDEIDEDTVMYLINAIVFDAEWKKVYNKNDIYKAEFTAASGDVQNSDFMRSEEWLYLDDGNAKGFVKPYANDKYSFAALLPNEGITVAEYIESLTGESFLNIIGNASQKAVNASMPKFSYDYKVNMNEILKEMGMPDAFDSNKADFNKLGRSSRGNIFIGEVIHKTFISVDELGTKAGAVTKVEMKDESYVETINIALDRPFIYAIIDNTTNLPIFLGVLTTLE